MIRFKPHHSNKFFHPKTATRHRPPKTLSVGQRAFSKPSSAAFYRAILQGFCDLIANQMVSKTITYQPLPIALDVTDTGAKLFFILGTGAETPGRQLRVSDTDAAETHGEIMRRNSQILDDIIHRFAWFFDQKIPGETPRHRPEVFFSSHFANPILLPEKFDAKDPAQSPAVAQFWQIGIMLQDGSMNDHFALVQSFRHEVTHLHHRLVSPQAVSTLAELQGLFLEEKIFSIAAQGKKSPWLKFAREGDCSFFCLTIPFAISPVDFRGDGDSDAKCAKLAAWIKPLVQANEFPEAVAMANRGFPPFTRWEEVLFLPDPEACAIRLVFLLKAAPLTDADFDAARRLAGPE